MDRDQAPDAPQQRDLGGVLRRVLIWGIFLALLYVLRFFFPFLLLTFIISYAGHSAVNAIIRRFPRWPRRVVVSSLFVVGLSALVGLGFLLGPLVQAEQRHFVQRFPELREAIASAVEDAHRDHGGLMQALDPERSLAADVRNFKLSDLRPARANSESGGLPLIGDVSPLVLDFARLAVRVVGTFLLSVLFSLLMLLDLARIQREVEAIRTSRIGWLYGEVRGTVVEFGATLGKVMEAQVVIAVVNTVLTFGGLALLGVPSKFLLSTLVFFFSFIPVLGVFLSTVPICLVALPAGGLGLVLKCIGMVLVVHAVEAYVVNPRITGSLVHLNAVFVLTILVVGEHFFGLWGLLLGVPVAVTLLRRTRHMAQSTATLEGETH